MVREMPNEFVREIFAGIFQTIPRLTAGRIVGAIREEIPGAIIEKKRLEELLNESLGNFLQESVEQPLQEFL